MEGVMMRSPHFYTVSVRDPEGKLQMKQQGFLSLTERFPFLKIPLVRGMIQLVESMIIGFRSLNYSNGIFLGEDQSVEAPRWRRLLLGALNLFYMVFALAFTLFLIKWVPLWVANQAAELWPTVSEHYFLFNMIDGITKIFIFLGYILAISVFKDIRRVFQYHGAEHKSIWTYEKGLPLTVENARAQTRFHPRCGTSFIFIVILISVLIYTVMPPADTFAAQLGIRLAVIPLIAGISYEILKLSARFQNLPGVKLLVMPGLAFQRFTTREPDDTQLEVALHALKGSLEAEIHPVP